MMVGVLGLCLLCFNKLCLLIKKIKCGGETKDQVRKRELLYATTYFKRNEQIISVIYWLFQVYMKNSTTFFPITRQFYYTQGQANRSNSPWLILQWDVRNYKTTNKNISQQRLCQNLFELLIAWASSNTMYCHFTRRKYFSSDTSSWQLVIRM